MTPALPQVHAGAVLAMDMARTHPRVAHRNAGSPCIRPVSGLASAGGGGEPVPEACCAFPVPV